MKAKIKDFITKPFLKKPSVVDRDVSLANMLVHHIQSAEQKPTAVIKK